MKEIKWSPLKSERLKRTRGVSFEELIKGRLVDILRHPKKENQEIMLIEYKGYIWAVPFIESGADIFLKTLYPNRKYTKMYKRRT